MAKTGSAKREINYWRVIITYTDGETSGNRVFKSSAKAETWAARQQKSPVVKKTKIEEFKREAGDWIKAKSTSSNGPKTG